MINLPSTMKYHFTLQDQIFFAQKLSLLLDSGISLSESLLIMRNMSSRKGQKTIFDFLIAQCEQGTSFSKSLVQSGARFDPLFISLVKSGEYSGSLSSALEHIYKNLEKRNELRKKVISTMIYPSFIFMATIGMTLFLVLFIFPKILPLLNSLNIPLPLLTRTVRALYENTVSYGIQIGAAAVCVFLIAYFLIKKIYSIRKTWHAMLLHTPLLKNYIRLSTMSSVCSTSEMLLLSNVSLYDVHDFSYESSKNLVYKNAFRRIRAESRKGTSLVNSLVVFPELFPKIMIEMCSIGERTGNLAIMFGHCAKIFEQDIDIFFKRFSALIEPTLMISMGFIVGSIALSIILPIYEITNHLNH